MFREAYRILNNLRIAMLMVAGGCIGVSACVLDAYVYDVDFGDFTGEHERQARDEQGRDASERCSTAEAEGREPSERDREIAREWEAEHFA